VRDLTPGEISGQVIRVMKDLGERVSNIVVMGIGEPFDNYPNLIKFLKNINHPEGVNLGYRHITVSTCGIVPKIIDFANAKMTELVVESNAQKAELAEFKAQVEYYRSFYFSERYGREYVNKTVYGSNTNVDEAEAQKVIAGIQKAFDESIAYADAKIAMAKAVDDYVKQVAVKTVLERACEEIEQRSSLNASNYLKPAKLVEACENAYIAHESLGTLEHYKKGENGEQIVIDLKTGKPVGDTTDLGDGEVLKRMSIKYQEALKALVNEEKQKVLDSNLYGLSANTKISDYVKYAKIMIESLGKYGRLSKPDAENIPEIDGYKVTQYKYGENNVIYGSDIVKAFKDSLTVNGALSLELNNKKVVSEKLDKYLLKSSLVYEKKNEQGVVEYTITLTCVNLSGEPIGYFEPESVLSVLEGASAAVERNVFLVLNGSKFEKATGGLKDADKEILKGKVFFDYFTLIVSAPKFAGGALDVLEIDKAICVQVTFDFKSSETLEKMVVYQALYGEYGIWVRPISMWNELVDVNGIETPRFKFLREE
jgi:hypothetical protein